MGKTIVLKDDRFLNHVTSYGHPECPERLEAIYAMLQQPDVSAVFTEVQPRPATQDEIALNHDRAYINSIEQTAGADFTSLDPDTSTSAGSWEAAVLAAGAVLTGIDMIVDGEASNGFALVRPPGHHAESSRAMGFCLFNNVAIGAHYLIKRHGMKRVLIFDWDIHHGNGTQNAFYAMPEVLYVSTHQYPYYPGSGAFEETGAGDGKGYTVNVPLPGGQGDADYLHLCETLLRPIAREYRPEFIIVSAGYDIYDRDPLGTMNVTPDGFAAMTSCIKDLTSEVCNGRLLFSLEGGYNVQGIAESVKQTLYALGGDHGSVQTNGDTSAGVGKIVDRVRQVHAPVWKCFS
ncbi:histone deacetylase [Thermodesulfobacteriota bacterium]